MNPEKAKRIKKAVLKVCQKKISQGEMENKNFKKCTEIGEFMNIKDLGSLKAIVVKICKKPQDEAVIYKYIITRTAFSDINRKKFHFLFLTMIYHGELELTLNWKVQTPDKDRLYNKPPLKLGFFFLCF